MEEIPTVTDTGAGHEKRLRAVIYLRVSTLKQASRRDDPEGYSLPAQREACHRKATELGADVVDEYIDRGESAKSVDRDDFQRMVERVKTERDVDLVILHKIDRFARNVPDDAAAFSQLKAAGAKLVSVSENIDETPQGMLVHWIMAAMAEFYSANLATEVKKGSLQKAKNGGTPYRAPLGYLNVQERIEGKGASMVVFDPDRADLVREVFELYATGDFTLRQLLDYITAKGLTCRATAQRPEAPLSLSKFATLLRKRYYLGVVTYAGMEYEGRHEPLIDHDTFERVQELLDSRIKAGEKQRLYQHYLKGTIYCRRCKSRLSLINATGRHGGKYPYFFCLGRQRQNGCDLPYLPTEAVEERIEALYGEIVLSETEATQLRAELGQQLQAMAQTSSQERQILEKQMVKLDRQRYLWAEKVMEGSVPDDIGREKQANLARQLSTVRQALANHEVQTRDVAEVLDRAMDLVRRCDQGYTGATGHQRRLWNQAFFKKIEVDRLEEGGVAELTPLIAGLKAPAQHHHVRIARRSHRSSENPGLLLVGQGSSESRLVGEGGLEPPHPFGHRNLNPARLPIPPLARVTGQH